VKIFSIKFIKNLYNNDKLSRAVFFYIQGAVSIIFRGKEDISKYFFFFHRDIYMYVNDCIIELCINNAVEFLL